MCTVIADAGSPVTAAAVPSTHVAAWLGTHTSHDVGVTTAVQLRTSIGMWARYGTA